MPELTNDCNGACACDRTSELSAADPPQPIACDLSAIPAAERATHEARAAHLLATAQATQELSDGYTFRYPAAAYPLVVEFIAQERLCCPFFDFGLAVPAGEAPLELRITGAPGVKAFMQGALGLGARRVPAHP